MDTLGKSDPFVEMWTTTEHVEKTTVKKRTLAPVWNETLFVLVQEPRTQSLRVEMFDWDAINLTVSEARHVSSESCWPLVCSLWDEALQCLSYLSLETQASGSQLLQGGRLDSQICLKDSLLM